MAQTGLDKVYERDFVDSIRKYLFDSKLREAAILPENSSLVSEELEAIFTGADIAALI